MGKTGKIATPKNISSGKTAKISKVPKAEVAKLTTIKYLR